MIVGAVLARNEAAPDRYLRRVLANVTTFCDLAIVLDDGSTDATAQVAHDAGARVHRVGGRDGFWGRDETSRRRELWRLAADAAGSTGWIYVADADHELIGLSPVEFRALCTADHVNAWAWPLLDCWDSDETQRVDGFWQAHRHPRPWLFRVAPVRDFEPDWGDARRIHSGHAPHFGWTVGVAPGWVRHLGYVKPEHRKAKAERYLALAET